MALNLQPRFLPEWSMVLLFWSVLAYPSLATRHVHHNLSCFRLCTLQAVALESINACVSPPPKVLSTLQWWIDLGQICSRIPFLRHFTDASFARWGEHMMQGTWISPESRRHINILERWVLWTACLSSILSPSCSHCV